MNVFGSEQLTILEMAREGFVLNVIGAIAVTIISWLTFS